LFSFVASYFQFFAIELCSKMPEYIHRQGVSLLLKVDEADWWHLAYIDHKVLDQSRVDIVPINRRVTATMGLQ